MTHITNLSIEEVYECITKRSNIRAHDSSIIIMGRSGRTGKTALLRRLANDGYYVTEISEQINELVIYKDDDNHVIVNENTGDTIIVLNRIF